MQKIGPNHGLEVLRKRLQAHDLAIQEDPDAGNAYPINSVLGEPGKDYDTPTVPNAIAKGTLRTLVADHDELVEARVIERIGAVEGRLDRLPFPFGASS